MIPLAREFVAVSLEKTSPKKALLVENFFVVFYTNEFKFD